MIECLRIVSVGVGTTLQDRGRPGWAHLGVPTAGPVDGGSSAVVNRLVGNPESALVLETAGGAVVEAVRSVIVSCSATASVTSLAIGEHLRVDAAPGRRWGYLAVRGGFVAATVLGSSSHDTLGGIGPSPLRRGDILIRGGDPGTAITADLAPVRTGTDVIRLWPGPHATDGVAAVVRREWSVDAMASRVGVRLVAVPPSDVIRLPRLETSEPLVVGAVQATPAGELIVMLADHPTTGGYPVVAVVDPDDVAEIAQRPTGARVRFAAAGGQPPAFDHRGLG